jgi:hypothetical protein
MIMDHILKWTSKKVKQEGTEDPGSLTCEIGQKVKEEALFTPAAQFENNGQLNLNNFCALSLFRCC